MYSVKQYLSSFVLVLSTAVSSWLVYKLPTQTTSSTIPADINKSYMSNVVIMRMDAISGKPQDELQTELMVHSNIDGKTDIVKPHFVIFQAVGEPWNLYGDHGQTQNALDVLDLWGNVVLTEPAGPYNQKITLTTSAVTIYPKKKYAETMQPITGTQPGSELRAIGMHTDFQTGIVNLLSNVQGTSEGQTKS